MGRTPYLGRRRPFLALLLKHFNTLMQAEARLPLAHVCFRAHLYLFFRIAEYHNFAKAANRTHVDMTFLIRYEARNRTRNL